MKKRNVIVIGAGPGGLAAAMQLAHAGANVTVLESKSQVGGRCSTMPLGDFRFDVGPTFYLYPRILKEIFQSETHLESIQNFFLKMSSKF